MSSIYISRYRKFIESIPKNRKYFPGCEYEKHHILPRSMFPDLISSADNIIILTKREHYIAHWMLAKIYGGKMWFAFNNMKRIISGDSKTGTLYEISKKYIGEEHRKFMLGRKHSDDTKAKIKENGISGKIVCNNGKHDIYVSSHDNIPNGYVAGRCQEFKAKCGHNKRLFYYNPISKKQIRISADDQVPDGFIKGRISGHQSGLAKMNDIVGKKYYNITTHKQNITLTPNQYQFNTPANGYIVMWNNFIFENHKAFKFLFPELPDIDINTTIKQHHNQTTERQNFCREHLGKKLSEFGISIVKIAEYVYNIEHVIIKEFVSEFDRDEFIRTNTTRTQSSCGSINQK